MRVSVILYCRHQIKNNVNFSKGVTTMFCKILHYFYHILVNVFWQSFIRNIVENIYYFIAKPKYVLLDDYKSPIKNFNWYGGIKRMY